MTFLNKIKTIIKKHRLRLIKTQKSNKKTREFKTKHVLIFKKRTQKNRSSIIFLEFEKQNHCIITQSFDISVVNIPKCERIALMK